MKEKKTIARREFLENIGKSAGTLAMLRTMIAMGLGLGSSACGSSSAGAAQQPANISSTNITNNTVAVNNSTSIIKSPRPGDWNTNIGNGKTVIILGAGIAGMSSAFELQKLGYTVTILEATNRAGGRNRTIRSGDSINELNSTQTCIFDSDSELYFNPGPARIAHHHEFLLDYCRQFRVILENFTNDNRAALVHSTLAFDGKPQLAKSVLSDIRGRISSLLAYAVNQNVLDQQLSSNDKINILRMLKGFGDLNSDHLYLGSSRAGFLGQENVGSRDRDTPVTPKTLQELIISGFQSGLDFSQGINQQPAMLQPKGGMDKIAQAFEARVLSVLTYNAEVTQIRKITNGVKIIYERNGSSFENTADFCVCTIPAPVLKNISNDFSNEHQLEIEQFQYSSASKLAFQSRRFWEQDHSIFGGISWTNQSITQLWYPSNALGSASGIIVGAYIWNNSVANIFSDQTPQARITSALQQGNNLHSEYQNEVSRGISVAWKNIPFQLGAYGQSSATKLLIPDDNIIFAGEHLSALKGWQEGAILSAYHAINEIVKKSSA